MYEDKVIEIKENLVNLLMINDNEDRIRELESRAITEDIFDTDNGRTITRKPKESLGNYIDRYTALLMKNFSQEKYNILKSLYKEYNSFGDNNIEVNIEIEKSKKRNYKKPIAVGTTAMAIGFTIFKFLKKRKK